MRINVTRDSNVEEPVTLAMTKKEARELIDMLHAQVSGLCSGLTVRQRVTLAALLNELEHAEPTFR